jgi:nitrogen-specific signal transduction histidine kinase
VRIAGEIRWILNLESDRRNAFSYRDEAHLEELLDDLKDLFQHLYLQEINTEIIQGASDMIIVTDARDHIVSVNGRAEQMLGLSSADYAAPGAGPLHIGALFSSPDAAELVSRGQPITPTPFTLVNLKTRNPREVILTRHDLPEDFGRKVVFGQDLSTMRRLEDLEAVRGAFFEIALQTRTPLSLIAHSLRRLERRVAPEDAKAIGKAIRQLHGLDLSYERLLRYDDSMGASSLELTPVDLGELVAAVKEGLPIPTEEESRIRLNIASDLPPVMADRFHLTFVFETILSYLLRTLPEDDDAHIDVTINPQDANVVMRIAGAAPPIPSAPTDESSLLAARARAEIALGEGVIRRLMDRHGGTYDRVQAGGEECEFHIRLPLPAPSEEAHA